MNKKVSLNIAVSAFSVLFASYAFSSGGLNAGTDALSMIKAWLFTFVGVGALVYLLFNIAMAFMERKSWGDVGIALVYCALTGGAVVAGTWALGLFQS